MSPEPRMAGITFAIYQENPSFSTPMRFQLYICRLVLVRLNSLNSLSTFSNDGYITFIFTPESDNLRYDKSTSILSIRTTGAGKHS